MLAGAPTVATPSQRRCGFRPRGRGGDPLGSLSARTSPAPPAPPPVPAPPPATPATRPPPP
eukprot:319127-Pyramimonas_sp.AAC.1